MCCFTVFYVNWCGKLGIKPEELMLVFLYISEKMIEAFYGNKMKSRSTKT